MKYNNAFNHIASQRDSISATDRYLRDTARDEALIRSYGLTNNHSSYAGYRQQAAQKACTALDNIKSNHIINLNNKFLSILKGVLKDEEITQVQNKNIPLMSPSVLGNHPLFKQLKQSSPELFAKYNKIIDEVSKPIDDKKQQILKLIQTDYGSQQHVEASQNQFTQTFRVNDYFEYLNNVPSAPICKPIVIEIAEEMFEEIKNSIPAENNIENEIDQINSNVQVSNANEEQDLIPNISVGVNSAIQNKSAENKKIKTLIENIVDINANIPNEQDQEAISRALQNIQERNSNDSSSDQHKMLQELENLKEKVENHANIIRDLQQNSSSNTSITHPFIEAFSNEASKCFTSAQAVLGGDLRLNENKDIKISIAKHCAKFLPVFGKVVSNVIKMKANKQTRKEIKEKCDKLNDFGITHTILDKWSKKTAKEILNDDDVQELLEDMSDKDMKKLAKEQVSNILTKICSGKYTDIIKVINSNKEIIDDLKQETLEKDDIIQKQGDENQAQDQVISDQRVQIQERGDTIVEQRNDIKSLKKDKVNLEKLIDVQEKLNHGLEEKIVSKDDEIAGLKHSLEQLQVFNDNSSNQTTMFAAGNLIGDAPNTQQEENIQPMGDGGVQSQDFVYN